MAGPLAAVRRNPHADGMTLIAQLARDLLESGAANP